MNRAVVLLSGGMDSLVSAAIAARDCQELYFLHFSYGQRTQDKERQCFEALVKYYNPVQSKIVDYHWLKQIGGSALVDTDMVINEHATDSSLIPNTYVPFRNATMLSAAVAWAEVIDANCIYIGAVEEDSSGYPDCREVFFIAYNDVIATGSKAGSSIGIVTPVIHLNKAEIIKLGMELKAPFELTWSCYQSQDKACGVCDSCRLRLRAFTAAGVSDPIIYR